MHRKTGPQEKQKDVRREHGGGAGGWGGGFMGGVVSRVWGTAFMAVACFHTVQKRESCTVSVVFVLAIQDFCILHQLNVLKVM